MNPGRHVRGTADRRGRPTGFARSVRAKLGRDGAHSRHPERVRTGHGRLRVLRRPIVLFACAFAVASGTAAFAYTTASGNGTGQAQAVSLHTPGTGTASKPTATSLSLSWMASPGLPPSAGYLILRSTSDAGPYAKVSSGTCQQVTTLVSAATSCTDTGLTAGTTYYYEVEAAYYDISTLWVSAPDAPFSATTGTAPAPSGTSDQPLSTTSAPAVTSASSTSFFVGTADSFQVTASGSPAPTFSNSAFGSCTPSTLPLGVTFSGNGLLSGAPDIHAVGTYTVCIVASNGISPNSTQTFTLTVATEALVFSSPVVSGATSGTPNLGPITVARQTGSGTPITIGGALTVNLTSSSPSGATFGMTQFSSARVTSVTIPSGQSSATFWYGLTTPGSPTISASAPGYVAGTQVETITPAPAGLGVALAPGSTGAPFLSCGPPSTSSTCSVTGVGTTGSVVFSVGFWTAGGGPVLYSATQASTIEETGQSTGSVTIGANESGSSPQVLTASLGTSRLTFGPYTLTINVSS